MFPNLSHVLKELKTRCVLRELVGFPNHAGAVVVDVQRSFNPR